MNKPNQLIFQEETNLSITQNGEAKRPDMTQTDMAGNLTELMDKMMLEVEPDPGMVKADAYRLPITELSSLGAAVSSLLPSGQLHRIPLLIPQACSGLRMLLPEICLKQQKIRRTRDELSYYRI